MTISSSSQPGLSTTISSSSELGSFTTISSSGSQPVVCNYQFFLSARSVCECRSILLACKCQSIYIYNYQSILSARSIYKCLSIINFDSSLFSGVLSTTPSQIKSGVLSAVATPSRPKSATSFSHVWSLFTSTTPIGNNHSPLSDILNLPKEQRD